MAPGPAISRRLVVGAAGAALLPLGGGAWACAAEGGPQRLIVILLRGAVDGLNVVVPYGDPAYYAARPTIAVARPGTPDGAFPLDEHFGLHPALAALMPRWRDGSLAFVHAAGSPDPNRSHFEAQRYIENGTPGRSTTADGWMNRLLQVLPGPRGPTEAISIGPTLPRILTGKAPVANVPLGPGAAQSMPIDRPDLAAAFDRLYAGAGSLTRAYREGRGARGELLGALAREQQVADAGAPPPSSFAWSGGQARPSDRRRPADPARLCRPRRHKDTHVDQGGAKGWLANRLRPLGDGLAALCHGLGGAWRDTVVAVLSEFGRTVHENAPTMAPTTATATSFGSPAGRSGAAGFTATGQGWRRPGCISGATSPSPPTSAPRWRRSWGLTWVLPIASWTRSFRAPRRRRRD